MGREGSTAPPGRGGLRVPAEPLNSLKYNQPLSLLASCWGRAEILLSPPTWAPDQGPRENRGPPTGCRERKLGGGRGGRERGTLPAAAATEAPRPVPGWRRGDCALPEVSLAPGAAPRGPTHQGEGCLCSGPLSCPQIPGSSSLHPGGGLKGPEG